MKSKRKLNKVGHFFRHYFDVLVLALICGVASVLLISFVAAL